MLKKRVHKILCIDATRKINQYKFPLRNLVVLGEFYKGYLSAHLICNTEDEPVLMPFFPAIKERCCNPNLQINATILDGMLFWDSLEIAPSSCGNWHLKWASGNKISLCGSQQLQEVYQTLEVILEGTLIETCEKMLVGVLGKYKYICPKFFYYFKST